MRAEAESIRSPTILWLQVLSAVYCHPGTRFAGKNFEMGVEGSGSVKGMSGPRDAIRT
jgi:hypothetical protein